MPLQKTLFSLLLLTLLAGCDVLFPITTVEPVTSGSDGPVAACSETLTVTRTADSITFIYTWDQPSIFVDGPVIDGVRHANNSHPCFEMTHIDSLQIAFGSDSGEAAACFNVTTHADLPENRNAQGQWIWTTENVINPLLMTTTATSDESFYRAAEGYFFEDDAAAPPVTITVYNNENCTAEIGSVNLTVQT